MISLGYMAKDSKGTLFNFEWGTGKFEGNFYILDMDGKHLDNVGRFDLLEIFYSVAE